MSDYLWDKKGEADAEVERLEVLLADLRHRPRPLELPAEDAAGAKPLPSRARPAAAGRIFGAARTSTAKHTPVPVWLAAAAVLLLAFMLGAALL